jgi:trans-aconitate methyltransferase
VSYQSRTTQYARFNVLAQNTIPNKTDQFTLLDLGCGLGDLYGYLQDNQYHHIAYTGVDIVPEMLDAARQNYPAATFKTMNFVTDELPEYDIILASGSLNILFDRAAAHAQYIKAVSAKMYASARLACAFNLLDKDVEYMYEQDPRFYYADKQEFLKYCRTLCPAARLIDGYLVNDFTLVLKH